MGPANEAVLKVLEENVLHPDVTETVVQKATDKFRASQQQKKNNRQQYYMRGSPKLWCPQRDSWALALLNF
jgi:hypothetical protein